MYWSNMASDEELIAYAERMARTVRPPLLDLLQRFLHLASNGDGKPKFDRNAYQREYMRKWRKRKGAR